MACLGPSIQQPIDSNLVVAARAMPSGDRSGISFGCMHVVDDFFFSKIFVCSHCRHRVYETNRTLGSVYPMKMAAAIETHLVIARRSAATKYIPIGQMIPRR